MKRIQRFPIRLGLLGGGQLARMLALKGHEMGLEIHVLSASASDPAAQVVRHHHKGDPNKESDLRSFLSHVDIATFESEFLDAGLLSRVSREQKIAVRPEPRLMGQIQDRLTQKELLFKYKLPTAAFSEVSSARQAEDAFRKFDGRFVLKKRRFGYDGYGTYIVRDRNDLHTAIDAVENDENGFIAETLVPFNRELALMLARRKSKETVVFPLVESRQENARCLWVKGPAPRTQAAALLTSRLARFLDGIGYEGIMGFELFEMKRSLLINELAPRVHNSAHYSLEALEEDQFTAHIKGVLDLPFAKMKPLSKGFAMLNLLGERSDLGGWKLPANVHLHWYGKSDNRPGRKMGHLTALGSSSASALKVLLESRKAFDV